MYIRMFQLKFDPSLFKGIFKSLISVKAGYVKNSESINWHVYFCH